jgi:hypothetical protein
MLHDNSVCIFEACRGMLFDCVRYLRQGMREGDCSHQQLGVLSATVAGLQLVRCPACHLSFVKVVVTARTLASLKAVPTGKLP